MVFKPTDVPKKQKKLVKVERDRSVLKLMDVLTAPVITHSALWKDCLPKRFLDLLTFERLAQLQAGREYAGDVETVLFIMTRTFESPMDHEWADIYTHLACKACERHFGEDHWEQVKAPRELTDYQERYLLMPLRKFIYEKRRNAVKSRIREEANGKE